jgi:hypothetical protein
MVKTTARVLLFDRSSSDGAVTDLLLVLFLCLNFGLEDFDTRVLNASRIVG